MVTVNQRMRPDVLRDDAEGGGGAAADFGAVRPRAAAGVVFLAMMFDRPRRHANEMNVTMIRKLTIMAMTAAVC